MWKGVFCAHKPYFLMPGHILIWIFPKLLTVSPIMNSLWSYGLLGSLTSYRHGFNHIYPIISRLYKSTIVHWILYLWNPVFHREYFRVTIVCHLWFLVICINYVFQSFFSLLMTSSAIKLFTIFRTLRVNNLIIVHYSNLLLMLILIRLIISIIESYPRSQNMI